MNEFSEAEGGKQSSFIHSFIQAAIRTGWRRLHNEELHNLYALPNILSSQIKKNKMSREYSMHKRD
jgi:hypothetical protein